MPTIAFSLAWSRVVNIAPELATVSGGSQTEFIADVQLQMNPCVWGSKLNLGAAYLAAHLATVSRRKGIAGALTEEHAGAVGHGFSALKGLSPLETTSYGLEYLRLLRGLPGARVAIAGCGDCGC